MHVCMEANQVVSNDDIQPIASSYSRSKELCTLRISYDSLFTETTIIATYIATQITEYVHPMDMHVSSYIEDFIILAYQ